MWVLMTAFLPTLHRVPSGHHTGLDSWACQAGKALGGRQPLLQSFLDLCSQDPCWKDDPQASLQGCFLLGTRLGSGLRSTGRVPGWPQVRRGPGLGLGMGMLAPWWQRWRMHCPRPRDFELFRLSLPQSITPHVFTKCQFRARHCSRPLRFNGEQGQLGSGLLVGKTDNKQTHIWNYGDSRGDKCSISK